MNDDFSTQPLSSRWVLVSDESDPPVSASSLQTAASSFSKCGISSNKTTVDLPWQVSAGFNVVVFVILKGIFPAIVSDNIYLQPLSAALSDATWLFSGAFFLIPAIVFAKEKWRKENPCN